MNKEQVKAILLAYRPGTQDQNHPEVAEALQIAQRDAELQAWLEQQAAFHAAVRTELREVPVPAALRSRILTQAASRNGKAELLSPGPKIRATNTERNDSRRLITFPFWRRPAVLLAAACVALALVLSALWVQRSGEDYTFAGFKKRMIGFAQRQYSMQILTSDPNKVRNHLRAHGAPADFVIPLGLQTTPVMGGARLTWQNYPVSMICFALPQKQTLYMFVIDQTAVRGGKIPPAKPVLMPGHQIMTATWSAQGKIYLIGAAVEEPILKQKIPQG